MSLSPPGPCPQGFAIKHYAATVPYTIDGFREKNMDPVEQTLRDAVQASHCAFTRDLLGPSDPTVAGVPPCGCAVLCMHCCSFGGGADWALG